MNSELNFDGKKYISARRASEICGYSSDYIGQLCRKGSLDCRRVGRVWFVEQESLNSHQEEAAKRPRGRIAIYQKEKEVQNVVSTVSPVITPAVAETIQTHATETLHFWGGVKHILPSDYLDEVKDKTEANSFALKVGSGLATLLLLVLSFPFLQNISIPTQGVDVSRAIPNTDLAANIFSASEEIFAEAVSSLPLAIHDLRLKTNSLTLAMYHKISLVTSATSDRMKKFASIASGRKEVEVKKDRKGIVVVPSTNDAAKDEQVKQYIKDSFSDETYVMPDGSGTSGAIKPVFRNKSEDEYLYVVVPVVDD